MYSTGTQIMLMDQPIAQHTWAKIQIKPIGGTLPQSPLHCPLPEAVIPPMAKPTLARVAANQSCPGLKCPGATVGHKENI